MIGLGLIELQQLIFIRLSPGFGVFFCVHLRHKLTSYGIPGQIFGLISSYSINRRLWVVLDGKLLSEYPVNAGVLQDSIFGALKVCSWGPWRSGLSSKVCSWGKKNILRCWSFMSLLKWISALTLSLFLKLLPRKLEYRFVLWTFLLLRLLCISIKRQYDLAWNTAFNVWAVAPSCSLEILDQPKADI